MQSHRRLQNRTHAIEGLLLLAVFLFFGHPTWEEKIQVDFEPLGSTWNLQGTKAEKVPYLLSTFDKEIADTE